MKLAIPIAVSLLLSAAATLIGWHLEAEEDAWPRAFAFGVTTFVLSAIAAFIVGVIATRQHPGIAALYVVALLFVVAGVSVIAYFAGDEKEAVPRAFALGFLTLVVAGGTGYLVYYFRTTGSLRLPKDELDEGEVLWAMTAQSMVHYKSGNPLKFWEAVGGRLFLTSEVLEFRSFPAELYVYRLIVPLREIRDAQACRILGFARGGLRIERHDGTFELFTFGAAFDISNDWAHAILRFRDDLNEIADPSASR